MEDYRIKDGVGLIPTGNTKIGTRAFHDCTELTKVVIPDSVTEIGRSAFSGCTGLTQIVIPDSVSKIGSGAFRGCTGLTKIIISKAVTEIGDWAFEECTRLTQIVIPGAVTKIGNRAFSDCAGLTEIIVTDGNSVYDSRNNCNAIIETRTNRIIAACTTTRIPESVTKIGDCLLWLYGTDENCYSPVGDGNREVCL